MRNICPPLGLTLSLLLAASAVIADAPKGANSSAQPIALVPVKPAASVVPAPVTKSSVALAATLRPFAGREAEYLRTAIAGSMPAHATDHFVLLSERHSGRLNEIAHLIEQTRHAFYDVFYGGNEKAAPIQERLVWIVFDGRESYEQYAQRTDRMDMSWSKAYYSAYTNRVAIALEPAIDGPEDGGRVAVTLGEGAMAITLTSDAQFCAQVTHEAGHQLAFNSGLQTRGVMYPLWVSEGLAANFEIDPRGRVGPGADNALRMRHLTRAVEKDQLVPIKQWVGLTRIPFNRPQQINAIYGQSWAFFRFLHEHHGAKLKQYLVYMARQPVGRRSEQALSQDFVEFFGQPAAMEKQWVAYLQKLQEPAPVK